MLHHLTIFSSSSQKDPFVDSNLTMVTVSLSLTSLDIGKAYMQSKDGSQQNSY